jgi:hypothetical protein
LSVFKGKGDISPKFKNFREIPIRIRVKEILA